MEKVVYALESFKNIQDLIKFADQKAGAVLIVVGLIFSAFVQHLEKFTFSSESMSALEVAAFILGFATIGCMTIVLYYSIFKILKPRFAVNYQPEELSTFYFDHIIKLNAILHEKYKSIDEECMLKDIVNQQIEVSNILNEKNKNLSKPFALLFASLFTSMIFILLSIQL